MADVERLYVDANILIYAIERPSGVDADLADDLLRLLMLPSGGPDPRIVSSELTLAEVLVGPYRMNDLGLAAKYEAIKAGVLDVRMVPISPEILRAAARIRSGSPAVKLPDALHLATAADAKCSHFLTADKSLAAKAQSFRPPLSVIEPTDMVVSNLIEKLLRNG